MTDESKYVAHKLSSGQIVWLIKGDLHTNWVVDTDRLDHDQWLLDLVKPYLDPEGTTIDIGAHIGTHTYFYHKHCKQVISFEPNPLSYVCLARNVSHLDNVAIYCSALGEHTTTVELHEDPTNAGACFVSEAPDALTNQLALDSFPLSNISFIKIDAEGSELNILRGALRTIERHRPNMLIEINRHHLQRNNHSPEDIKELLTNLNYAYRKIHPTQPDVQYDLLCVPG